MRRCQAATLRSLAVCAVTLTSVRCPAGGRHRHGRLQRARPRRASARLPRRARRIPRRDSARRRRRRPRQAHGRGHGLPQQAPARHVSPGGRGGAGRRRAGGRRLGYTRRIGDQERRRERGRADSPDRRRTSASVRAVCLSEWESLYESWRMRLYRCCPVSSSA